MAKHIDSNDDPVASLLQHAGKRAAPPPEMVERVRVQVHAAWRQELARRRRNRLFAVAASIFALVLGGWWAMQLRGPQAPVIVASIERSATSLRVHAAGEESGAISGSAAGTLVAMGDRLETGPDAGAVLRVSDGAGEQTSLRLAPGTSLVWQAPDRVRLLRGQLYLDTGISPPGTGGVLVIEAVGARIEHMGTRFLVALSVRGFDVKVRDGKVRIQTPGEVALLQDGEHGRLTLDASGTTQLERLRAGSSGEDWAWVDALAPRLNIDNQNLLAVLLSVAHEGGIELRFESEEVEREAGLAVLHGPALEMPPRQALDAILVTTAYIAVPDGGSHLLVRRR